MRTTASGAPSPHGAFGYKLARPHRIGAPMFLRNAWYVAAWDHEVSGERP